MQIGEDRHPIGGATSVVLGYDGPSSLEEDDCAASLSSNDSEHEDSPGRGHGCPNGP